MATRPLRLGDWIESHKARPLIGLGLGIVLGAVFMFGAIWRLPILSLQGEAIDPDCDTTYDLLDPSFRCSKAKPVKEYEAFREELADWIRDLQISGKVNHVSIYFRDLKFGPWFGINEDEEFSPASLLKLPIMLAVFKQAQQDPSLLQREIGFSGDLPGPGNLTSPDETILPDQYYTVDELVRRMIVYSDNDSKELLKAVLRGIDPSRDLLSETYIETGLMREGQTENDIRMTVKMYSGFFRILHRALYLNREYSQRALALLSDVTFRDGLVKSLPPGVRVAHKFGVRNGIREGDQLHDCGIVYHPVIPYLVCVMTRGNSLEHDSEIISEASRKIYEEVDARARLLPATPAPSPAN